MKPSFTNQDKVSVTDSKFRPKDEHLIEENKEEVAKIHHGDKLETEHSHDDDSEERDRATAP